jgi:hypothetical protein
MAIHDNDITDFSLMDALRFIVTLTTMFTRLVFYSICFCAIEESVDDTYIHRFYQRLVGVTFRVQSAK